MKVRVSTFLLLLAVCCASGRAQTVTPSIKIGAHTLTLGMPESSVLEQLGTDLKLRHLGTGSVSSWMVERKVGSVYSVVGNVVFEAHVLTAAIRYWEIQESSSKSLFYALNDAINSAQTEGFNTCAIATNGGSQTMDSPTGEGSGSLNTREITMDCGPKRIKVTMSLSDTPGVVPMSIEVTEWLRRK